uniref:Cadherin-1 n=1 Tax=Sphaeramia orbicularis TaxID=375764 RepID=A0A672ZR42_9TELE
WYTTIINLTTVLHSHVLFFPKATQGLKRRKREWIIPDIKVSENERGPFPQRVVQIRSSEDKEKVIHYSITGHGADLDPVNLFRMEMNTGWLLVTQPLDREKQSNYTFQAHAVADGGTAENPMDIKVIVIDQNDNNPIFNEKTYLGEVAESSPVGFEILKVVATDADEPDNDNSDIRYSITNQEPKKPSATMFEINPVNGVIRVNAQGLDREKFSKYTLDVTAADYKGLGLQGRTQVILTITDSNDNAPVYTQTNVKNKVDAFVTKMTVTDEDDAHTRAWNAKFTIVDGDPGGLFTVKTGLNKQEGIITTAKGLDFEMSRKHTLLVAVENEVPFATNLPTATATVVVNVEDVNEAPIFDPEVKQVAKPENLDADSEVVRYTAHDPDTALNQKVMYKILRDPAGWLNVAKDTGVITVKTMMDREHYLVKDDIYTALIGAYDDGRLNVNQKQEENPDPISCHLTFTVDYGSSNTKGIYYCNMISCIPETGIILNLAKQLDHGMYTVILKVGDNQGMEQDSTIQAEVCDCTGKEAQCNAYREAGVPLPIILGILGGILLLLMLVLLLLLFARRRGVEKKEPLLQDDDVRDNIYYYDEEGGGEDDQDYDLSVLHRGLDNKPDVFRNDVIPNFMPAPHYRPRPANPEEIGNFIDDNLKAADNDPTAPPYDSLLVFDYEGGGSDAGSLSSLNSSSSGDQDYDCLNEWGPRFKKLADMYGGGDDDDML